MSGDAKYGELEIGLLPSPLEAIQVELRVNDPDNQAEIASVRGQINITPEKLLEKLFAQKNDPDEYGKVLTGFVFESAEIRERFGETKAAFERSGMPIRLRVHIASEFSTLHGICWELLRDPKSGNKLATSERIVFSRFIRSHDNRRIELRPKAKLKTLLAVASPTDLTQHDLADVDVEGEIARASASLAELKPEVIGHKEPLTLNRLIEAICQGVDILYLVCHGEISRKTIPQLLLQNEDGTTDKIEASKFAERINGLMKVPRLIVLASCESAGTELGDRGYTAQIALAPQLAEAGVPAVLAMQGKITMETVKRAMPIFFTELLKDGQIERAMAVARGTVQDQVDGWIPVLFTRLKNGRIWNETGTADAHFIEAQQAIIPHQNNQQELRNISSQIAELPTQLAKVFQDQIPFIEPSQFDLETSPIVQEKIHFNTIDLAFGLLKDGKPKSARGFLEKLRSDIASNNPSTDLQFRLAVNLGMCALQLDEPASALGEFEFALRLKPDSKTSISQAALAAMAEGMIEQALDYARRSRVAGDNDANITANFLRVLYFSGRIEELERVVEEEEWISKDPNCTFVLGMIRLDQGKTDEAEKWLTVSITVNDGNPHAHSLLAHAMVNEIEQRLANDPPLDWRMPLEVRDRLSKADEHLERALAKLKEYENASVSHDPLILRSHVLRMLGKESEALQICERVLSAEPTHAEALKHKGQLLLMKRRADEALECFQKLSADEATEGIVISLAQAHREKKEYGKVIDLLAQHWEPPSSGRRQLIIAELLLISYHRLGKAGKIAEVLDGLRRERSNDPDALALISQQLMREGKKSEAHSELLNALVKALTDNQRERISLQLAEYYYEVENWSEASKFFGQILPPVLDDNLARKYLLSLYKAGLFREALVLSQQLRGSGDAIPFVSEIEAHVLEWVGDLSAALNLYEQLSQIEPRTPAYRVGIARLKNRLHDFEGAREALSKITYEDVKDDGLLLMQVAQFRQHLEIGDELRYAYRARRLKSNDPEIHLAYAGMFLNRSTKSAQDLEVTEVIVGSAVKLSGAKGQEIAFVIEDEEPDVTRNEIHSGDQRATSLIGCQAGSEVVFNSGMFDETRWVIVEVKSKYIQAFQQTMLEFQNWFTHPGLRAMDVGGEDFSGFFTMLDRQYHRNSQVLGLYKEKILPLGGLAGLLGKNLYETWGGLTNYGGARLYASTGEPARMALEAEVLKKNDSIVLELSALLTLNLLGLLDKLPRLFDRLVVPRQVIDEVTQWLTPQIGEGKPVMTVWKDERGYMREEVTEEMLANRKSFLEKIRDFINSNATVIPVNKLLDLQKSQIDQYEELLGTGPMSSLFASHELKLPLYSDDLGLSLVAMQDEWDVTGCSTQSVLLRMKNRGLFSAVRYWEALRVLIISNYFFISVDATALWWMCQQNQKKATVEMRRILKQTLQGPECEVGSALQVGAQFIYKVWLEVSEMDEKLLLIESVTDAMVTGRNQPQIKLALKATVARIFGPYQSPLPKIFNCIEAVGEAVIPSSPLAQLDASPRPCE